VALSGSLMMRRGISKRCPVCSQGHLFRRWVVMAEVCPRCGLVFRRAPGQWLGSWFLNICVTQAAVALVLIVGVATSWPAPPMWAIGITDMAVAVTVPFLFFPFSRTIWTAVDLAMRPLEFGEGVAPGFELDHRFAGSRPS
jgi:uncharacterized protein (DUF983 family)